MSVAHVGRSIWPDVYRPRRGAAVPAGAGARSACRRRRGRPQCQFRSASRTQARREEADERPSSCRHIDERDAELDRICSVYSLVFDLTARQLLIAPYRVCEREFEELSLPNLGSHVPETARPS